MLPRILHHLPSSTVLRAFAAHKMCGSLVQSVLVVHLPRSLLSSLRLHQTSVVLLRPLATFRNRPSLAARAAEFPEVVRQWHPHKNMVGPESVTSSSAKMIWFMCDEGHEWEARLCSRTNYGAGCPTCNTKRATNTNTLLAKYPAVAAEWHPTKN
eukprot:Colp12_sorted_trinity150504_noHs@23806